MGSVFLRLFEFFEWSFEVFAIAVAGGYLGFCNIPWDFGTVC